MFVGDSVTLVTKLDAHLPSHLFEVDLNQCIRGRILDGVIEKYNRELLQESLIAKVCDVLAQVALNTNTLGLCERPDTRASLLDHFVQIQRFTIDTELACVGHRQGEERLDNPRQTQHFFVDHVQGLDVFLRTSWLRKHKLGLTPHHVEGRTQFVRGVRDKLTILAKRNVEPSEKQIERGCEAAEFIMPRGKRQQSLTVRLQFRLSGTRALDSFHHAASLLDKLGNRLKASSDVPY